MEKVQILFKELFVSPDCLIMPLVAYLGIHGQSKSSTGDHYCPGQDTKASLVA